MEDNTRLIESLIERTAEYSKTSFELGKLKALDKASDVVSTVIPHSIVFFLLASFMLFLNLGLAFWFGNILSNYFYGFFLVAGFYGIIGIVFHFFMHKWVKKSLFNYFIKQLLK